MSVDLQVAPLQRIPVYYDVVELVTAGVGAPALLDTLLPLLLHLPCPSVERSECTVPGPGQVKQRLES